MNLEGNRKFILMGSAMLMLFALTISGHLSGDDFWKGVSGVAAAFGIGNGMEHLGNRV